MSNLNSNVTYISFLRNKNIRSLPKIIIFVYGEP